jgi:hypothetical protein
MVLAGWGIFSASFGLLIWVADSLPSLGDWWLRKSELKLVGADVEKNVNGGCSNTGNGHMQPSTPVNGP